MNTSANWSRENLAWAAGLFEGEGCIHDGRNTPVMSLATTDEDVLRKFHLIIGLGTINGPYQRGTKKPVWAWSSCGFRSIQAIVCAFWNSLCKRRKEKAIDVLEKWSKKKYLRQRSKLVCKRNHERTLINTGFYKDGKTYCKMCLKFRDQLRRIKNGTRHLRKPPDGNRQ